MDERRGSGYEWLIIAGCGVLVIVAALALANGVTGNLAQQAQAQIGIERERTAQTRIIEAAEVEKGRDYKMFLAALVAMSQDNALVYLLLLAIGGAGGWFFGGKEGRTAHRQGYDEGYRHGQQAGRLAVVEELIARKRQHEQEGG